MKKFLILFLFLISTAKAQTLLVDDQDVIHLTENFEYYIEQPNETIGIKDFLKKEKQFIEKNSTSFQKQGVWYKKQIEIKNKKENRVIYFLHAPLDFVDFFLLDYRGNVLFEGHTGDNIVPFEKSRTIKHRLGNIIIKAEYFQKQREDIFYVAYRIKTNGSNTARATISTLDIFSSYVVEDYLWGGFYFGGIFLISLYNFFIFLYIKEIKYFFYIGYLISVSFTQTTLNGYFFQYFSSNIVNLDVIVLVFFSTMTAVFLVLFVLDYLGIRKNTIRIIGVIFLVCSTTIIFSIPILNFQLLLKIVSINIAIGSIYCFVTALISHFKEKNRQAKYIIFAFSYFFIGVMVYILKTFGFLESNFFTENAIQVGNTAEALLMSLGLANRIQFLRKESENLNANLKHEVMVRTIEIQTQKEQIEKNYAELKNSKDHLSKMERESTINQIAAYLAHEVNNPLNFISLSGMIVKENITKLHEEFLSVLDDSREGKKFAQKIETIIKETTDGVDLGVNGTKKILEIISEISAITGVDGIHIDSCNVIEILLISIEEIMKKNQVSFKNIEVTLDDVGLDSVWKFEPKFMLSQKVILSRVLRTVINNAIFFSLKTPRSKPKIQITTKEITKDGNSIFIISIKNNGPTIRIGKEKGLFELQNKNSYGSELIGLSMVRELMKKIQGNLSLVDNGQRTGWVEFQIIINDYK